jgi:hypothetical protein
MSQSYIGKYEFGLTEKERRWKRVLDEFNK